MFRPQFAGQVPMLRGDLYRATHQASVDSILGARVRTVYSRGSSFYNYDFWPLRTFVVNFCAWVKAHPGVRPSRDAVFQIVSESNTHTVPHPHIVIAATPNELPLSVANALVGGCYHEAWHTRYSRRTPLQGPDVWALVDSMWDKIADPAVWARLAKPLNDWANVVEDIRIERCGIRDYPGTEPKMHDLQDFILDMEEESRDEASRQTQTAYSAVTVTFRDVGLGYGTAKAKEALARYKSRNEKAVQFVLDGPLSDLLREAIQLSAEDNMGCLRLAMEVIARIYAAGEWEPPEDPTEETEENKPQPQPCSNCGADPAKLKIRPRSGDDPATIECTECGHQEELQESLGAAGSGPSAEQEADWKTIADELLEQVGHDLLDNNQALEAAIVKEMSAVDSRCVGGERPYRPYDTSFDTVQLVGASPAGQAVDAARAEAILTSVRTQCSFLRARLRSIVRAAEQTDVEHGTRWGRRISERRLTHSKADLMAGEPPRRPYFEEAEQQDTSLAAVVVLDESGSMASLRTIATKVLMALVEPLDALGCATMAIGFRDGAVPPNAPLGGRLKDQGQHRVTPVCIDVFKTFSERFATVKWRFANTQSVGGTPMADGVQMALEQLSGRPEGHRVVFVVTDGMPNAGHAEVMRHQIRIARESGILVVGVGIGRGAQYVQTTFPDHVYTEVVEALPEALVRKLNEIMDFRGRAKRGLRLKPTT